MALTNVDVLFSELKCNVLGIQLFSRNKYFFIGTLDSTVKTVSPELTLDLDPARAAQEGPGVVPLLHRHHAGAQHLQPQVEHLLTGGGGGGRTVGGWGQ